MASIANLAHNEHRATRYDRSEIGVAAIDRNYAMPQLSGVGSNVRIAPTIAIDRGESAQISEVCGAFLWIGLTAPPTDAWSDAIVSAVEDRFAGRAIVDVRGAAALDWAWGVLADRGCTILSDPHPIDRQLALASIWGDPAVAAANEERDDPLTAEMARLREEVGRMAAALAALTRDPSLRVASASQGLIPAPEGVADDKHGYGQQPSIEALGEDRALAGITSLDIRKMIRMRRLRERHFAAELFSDPAWDMLLDLTAARIDRRPVSVSSLCIPAAVPATTALRWIKTMTEAGLFVRRSDPQDGRRVFIALSDHSASAMHAYFADIRAVGSLLPT